MDCSPEKLELFTLDCSSERLELFKFMDHKYYLRKKYYVWCKKCKCSVNSEVAIYPCKGSPRRPVKQGILESKILANGRREYTYKGKTFMLDILHDEMI